MTPVEKLISDGSRPGVGRGAFEAATAAGVEPVLLEAPIGAPSGQLILRCVEAADGVLMIHDYRRKPPWRVRLAAAAVRHGVKDGMSIDAHSLIGWNKSVRAQAAEMIKTWLAGRKLPGYPAASGRGVRSLYVVGSAEKNLPGIEKAVRGLIREALS